MTPTLTVIIALLAIWRLARLATIDELTRPLRKRIIDRRDGAHVDGQLAYLVTCPWCASVWIGMPVAFAIMWWPDNRALLAVLIALAGSGVAGMLVTVEDRLDR